MGYELKLNVCSTLHNFAYDGTSFYNPDYSIDLYNPGHGTAIYRLSVKHLPKNTPEIVWYRYANGTDDTGEDFDIKLVKDMYNQYCTPCWIDDVIDALEFDFAIDDYRRFDIALAILNKIRAHFPNAQVFFEGY